MAYDSTKVEYFIYKTTADYGYQVKEKSYKRFSIDSFLKERSPLIKDDLDIEEPDKSTIAYKNIQTSPIGSTIKYKLVDPRIDSIDFRYRSDVNSSFSLSKKLDEVGYGKLVQVTWFLKGLTKDSKPKYITLLLEKLPIENLPAIRKHIQDIRRIEANSKG